MRNSRQESAGIHPQQRFKIALIIEGGIGDMFGYSVLLRNLKKEGHELHVTAAFPEILQNNPNITTLQPFIYDNNWYSNIASKCDKIVRRDFYREHIVSKTTKHISQLLCEMHNTSFDNIYPDYFITEEEDNFAKNFIEQFDKPTILMQTWSGINPIGKELQSNNKHWKINYVEDFVKKMHKDYILLHIGMDTDPIINNTYPIRNLSVRKIIALLKYSSTFLGVDSFLQHASAVWKKQGVVLFGKSPLQTFSYPHNINMQKQLCDAQPCGRPEGGLLDIVRTPEGHITNWMCPNYICQDISADEVIENFKNILEK